jgi:hypothetical protein
MDLRGGLDKDFFDSHLRLTVTFSKKEEKIEKEKSKYTHFELEQTLIPTPQSRYHPLRCSSINGEADAAAASCQ